MQNRSLYLFKLTQKTFNNFYRKRLPMQHKTIPLSPKKCLTIRNNSKTLANPTYRRNKYRNK